MIMICYQLFLYLTIHVYFRQANPCYWLQLYLLFKVQTLEIELNQKQRERYFVEVYLNFKGGIKI